MSHLSTDQHTASVDDDSVGSEQIKMAHMEHSALEEGARDVPSSVIYACPTSQSSETFEGQQFPWMEENTDNLHCLCNTSGKQKGALASLCSPGSNQCNSKAAPPIPACFAWSSQFSGSLPWVLQLPDSFSTAIFLFIHIPLTHTHC